MVACPWITMKATTPKRKDARSLRSQPSMMIPSLFSLSWMVVVIFSSWSSLSSRNGVASVVDASSLPITGQLSTEIPPLSDVLEMAHLSRIVYDFRGLESCPNATSSSLSSRKSSSPSSSSLLPPHITCHWYHHNQEYGTQVLIVSSQILNYVAVVFAGTDDLRTALTDGDILMTSFGLIRNDTTELLLPSDVRIHAGFARGLFQDELMPQIQTKVEQAMLQLHNHRQQQQQQTSLLRWRRRKTSDKSAVRLFTTGHSLGAADSILTAVALTLLWNSTPTSTTTTTTSTLSTPATLLPFQVNITSINFGCPQTGNYAWRQAVHEQLPIPNKMVQQLGIWRLVLGWDLVPRLPTSARPIVLWQHVGHTIQLRRLANRTECYYLHYGSGSDSDNNNDNAINTTVANETVSYAGVPLGWSTTPFVILPSALYSHSIIRYLGFLQNKSTNAMDDTTNYEYYCNDFVKHIKYNDSDHHHVAPDDDFWIQPPKAASSPRVAAPPTPLTPPLQQDLAALA